MVRDIRFKYVHRYPYGPHELYDLAKDPGEESNLTGLLEHSATERHMRERLVQWFRRYVDPERDGAYEGVTGSGQVGLCGRAAAGANAFSAARIEHVLF
jgi:choline-sulfatase